jgi:hypothetical protein
VETEPSIKARKPRLNDLQHEHPPASLFFLAARAGSHLLLLERFRLGVVLALDFRQIAQKFANRRSVTRLIERS